MLGISVLGHAPSQRPFQQNKDSNFVAIEVVLAILWSQRPFQQNKDSNFVASQLPPVKTGGLQLESSEMLLLP